MSEIKETVLECIVQSMKIADVAHKMPGKSYDSERSIVKEMASLAIVVFSYGIESKEALDAANNLTTANIGMIEIIENSKVNKND
ncbi:hypothetical protein [Dickeya phage Sucellus]|nr:hypothetical protein [Dickeya phage Sucellus]